MRERGEEERHLREHETGKVVSHLIGVVIGERTEAVGSLCFGGAFAAPLHFGRCLCGVLGGTAISLSHTHTSSMFICMHIYLIYSFPAFPCRK